jgi:hypothetical protein
MARGTKKTIEALESLFETGDKPTQQDFWDWMSSFYHKDEDLAFLIKLAQATVTDVQAGENNSRFMTPLRTYQAILWWVRLGKLPLLFGDIQELITENIDAFNTALLAVNDADNVIDTLGEVYQAFEGETEDIGLIRKLRLRIQDLELVLHEVPKNLRQVQNTFDSLQSQVTAAQNSANNAQSTANLAESKADNAQGTANTAESKADAAQSTGDTARAEAAAAQGTANLGVSKADNAQGTADSVQTQHTNLAGYVNGFISDAALNANIAYNVLIPGLQDYVNWIEGRVTALGG